jgi:hypothetical protein
MHTENPITRHCSSILYRAQCITMMFVNQWSVNLFRSSYSLIHFNRSEEVIIFFHLLHHFRASAQR